MAENGLDISKLYEEVNALREFALPMDIAGSKGVRRLLELMDELRHRRSETTRLRGLVEPRRLKVDARIKYEEKSLQIKIRVHASVDEGIKKAKVGSREEREAHSSLAFFDERKALFELRLELAGLQAFQAFVKDVREDIDDAQQTLRKEVDLAGIEVRLES